MFIKKFESIFEKFSLYISRKKISTSRGLIEVEAFKAQATWNLFLGNAMVALPKTLHATWFTERSMSHMIKKTAHFSLPGYICDSCISYKAV